MTFLLVVGLLAGLAPRASSQTADDVGVVVGNVPGTGSTLVAGVQHVLDVLTDTQSAVDTSEAFIDALGDAGVELFWGISLEGPNPGSNGSVAGYVIANVASRAQFLTRPVVVLLDDQSGLFDALEDPTAIDGPQSCFPGCPLFSLDELANILKASPEAVDGLADRVQLSTVHLAEGDLCSAWYDAVANGAVFRIGQLLAAGRASGPPTERFSPVYVVGATQQQFLAAVSGELGCTVLADPAVVNALEPLIDAGAPVQEPLLELLEGIEL